MKRGQEPTKRGAAAKIAGTLAENTIRDFAKRPKKKQRSTLAEG